MVCKCLIHQTHSGCSLEKLCGHVMSKGTQFVGECSSSSSSSSQQQYIGDYSSSTSWSSSQQDTEDDRMIALVLSEEYANLDGAVGRRLSNLAPVPVR